MKCLNILVFLVIFSMVFTAKVSRMHRRHRTRDGLAVIQSFFKGFYLSFDEKGEAWKDFNECLDNADTWKKDAKAEEKKDEGAKELKNEQSTFQTILKYIGIGVDIVCKLKSKIINWLTGAEKRYRRRYLRLLAQGKRVKFNPFKKLWSWFTGGVKAVTDAAKELADYAKKKYDEVQAKVQVELDKILNPVMKKIDDLRVKFEKWLSQYPILKGFYDWCKCAMKSKFFDKLKKVKGVVVGFITMLPTLGSAAGWIKVAVNLVCAYKTVGKAIDAIKDVVAGTNKSENIGKFIGYFMQAVV